MKKQLKIIILFFFIIPSVAFSQAELVGQVIAATGSVIANNPEMNERDLERRSSVFEKDTIVTGENAKVQIRFTDGSLISLKPHTSFVIQDYSYQTDEDKFLSTLIEGGLRAISGVVGRSNPENYKVKTPIATIGIRGTYFKLQLIENGLFVGVYDGEVCAHNEAESLCLGEGFDYDYAFITRDKMEGLDGEPSELQEVPFNVSVPPEDTTLIINPKLDPPEVEFVDLRLEGVGPRDRTGFLVTSVERLKATSDPTNPVFTSSGIVPADVIKIGDAVLGGSDTFEDDIHFGFWNTDPGGPVKNFTDPNDLEVFEEINGRPNIHWVTAELTSLADIDAVRAELGGEVRLYSVPLFSQGTGQVFDPDNIFFIDPLDVSIVEIDYNDGIGINFDLISGAVITAEIEITDSLDGTWTIPQGQLGDLNGNGFTINFNDASYSNNTQPGGIFANDISGTITAGLTDTDFLADTVVGGFSLDNGADIPTHLEGVFGVGAPGI